MLKSLAEKINELSPQRRKKVGVRAAALIAKEMTLRDLRAAMKMTQERLAECLNIRQDNVCRIEQRSDLMISTLRSYVQAMGGKLHIVAKFPNRRPVEISGLADMDEDNRRASE